MRRLLGQTLATAAWLLVLQGAALAAAMPKPEELPDWSGVWELRGGTLFDRSTADPPNGVAGAANVRERPPYNAAWEKKYLANIALVAKDLFPDPNQLCGLPTGFPRIFNMPAPTEFIIRPEETWVITELGPNLMRIYTDGRDHPPADEIAPSFTGDSVGHWEGQTLVFDTVGINGYGNQLIDRTGVVTSDKLHITTRMGQVGRDLLRIDMVLEDPVAFTGPWKVTKTFTRAPPEDKIYEYACAENNRNPVDKDGFTLMMGPDGKPVNAPRK